MLAGTLECAGSVGVCPSRPATCSDAPGRTIPPSNKYGASKVPVLLGRFPQIGKSTEKPYT